MPRGPLGFFRLTSFGPFTFDQTVRGTEAIEEVVLDIIEEENIDADEIGDNELNLIIDELSERVYPDEENEVIFDTPQGHFTKKDMFVLCLASEWADDWSGGFIKVTTEISSPVERLIMTSNGCVGIVEGGPAAWRIILE